MKLNINNHNSTDLQSLKSKRVQQTKLLSKRGIIRILNTSQYLSINVNYSVH